MKNKRRARVLYLTPGVFDKGGISRYGRYQIEALRCIFGRENVRVLSLLGPDTDSLEIPFSVSWHGKGADWKSKICFLARTLRELMLWKPDIVHSGHVNISGVARWFAMASRSRTVLNTYGLEVWSGLRADAEKGLRNTDAVVSDCYFTAEYLENEGYRRPGTTTVIWDCVDTNRFTPGVIDQSILDSYGIPAPDEHFIVMTLGRISHSAGHKGYERLIEAFAFVAAENSAARLIIGGSGDMVENLVEQVKAQGILEQVVFTGSVAEKDLAMVYRAADLFSLVSDRGKGRGEGIPLTPLEAMSCGVPIVVGNHDGSMEAVVESENGYIVDPFDRDRHVEIIFEMMNDETKRSEKGKAAASLARARFSFDRFVKEHRTFYEDKIKSTS